MKSKRKTMKVLNLYACLGGNRLLWEDCEVTAVELDPELARMYQERFPNDTVIIGDAHQYLLDNHSEYDFVWTSTPCPSHSRARFWGFGKIDPIYPDLKLYEEILFLMHYFKGKWVAENVVPFYDPLIPGKKIGRHMFWSNFIITHFESQDANINRGLIGDYEKLHKIDLSSYKGKQRKDKIGRNLVHYDTGLHIFNLAREIHEAPTSEQSDLFN